ncbi:hypothetical protein F5X99DRAFT_399220 [Biscogniauxia marginata]|nr:hypothetical protein F5X99DRAFT_399220 [Biscogniauxia marginata]
MARRGARSIVAAEKRALAGDNESQDSQAALVSLMILHGVGVYSSSPARDDLPRQIEVLKEKTTRPTTSHPVGDPEGDPSPIQHPQNQDQDASDALPNPTCQLDAAANSPARQSTNHSHRRKLSAPPSPRSPLNREPDEDVHPLIQPISHDAAATSTLEPPRPLSRNDAPPQLRSSSAPLRKNKTHKMSSQSPTQSNEDRSYEQYTNDASQPQSTQSSSLHEHRTLLEHDTGFLDFNAQLDLPGTAPTEHDTNAAHNLLAKSQVTSQPPLANGVHDTDTPKTPAIARLFAQENNEPLMGPSQLFGQTQWTSAMKKASPTSSRPSPHLFNHNTISPNPAISSPLKDRGLRTSPTDAFISSPSAFPRCSSQPPDVKTSPIVRHGHRSEDRNHTRVSESPPELGVHRGRKSLEPISEYKPFRRDSENSDSVQRPHQGDDQDSDFDEDVTEYRRLRAKSKKERASKSFPPVVIVYPDSDKANIEVPSTSRTEPSKITHRTSSEQYLDQCYGRYPADNDGSQETVADSQDVPAQKKSAEAAEKVPKPSDETDAKPNDNNDVTASSVPVDSAEYGETIPETSPPGTFAEHPRLISEVLNDHSSATPRAAASSLPVISSSTGIEQEKRPDLPKHGNLGGQASSSSVAPGPKPNPARETIVQSSPSLVLESPQEGNLRRSTRLKNIGLPVSTSPNPSTPSSRSAKTSILTTLSTTPNITPSTTENSGNYTEEHALSPTLAKTKRQGRPPSSLSGSSSVSKAKTYSRSRDSFRKAVHQSPYTSSADELGRSPSLASGIESRKPEPRKVKVMRQSTVNQPFIRESMHRHGIFEGMVFAISFQEQPKPQKNKGKNTDRDAVERMIRQEGGRILPDGFNALFSFDSLPTTANTSSTSVMSNSLQLRDQETGFTALIADRHSRKVKYMQALALGIPCLAPRWVTTCVSKKEVVDWSSYLLCAGPSALLGDAIRSRNLQPYDACTAKLVDMICHRPKLLEESKILLVMKKSKNEEKRLPYVFLAQVLGASLVRVHSLEEARAKLREGEVENKIFDWVYVDDHLHNAQTALFGPRSGDGISKKRKRQSTSVGGSDHPPKRIRTLNDELVIQSLILGRLIEEEEMEE